MTNTDSKLFLHQIFHFWKYKISMELQYQSEMKTFLTQTIEKLFRIWRKCCWNCRPLSGAIKLYRPTKPSYKASYNANRAHSKTVKIKLCLSKTPLDWSIDWILLQLLRTCWWWESRNSTNKLPLLRRKTENTFCDMMGNWIMSLKLPQERESRICGKEKPLKSQVVHW